MHSPAAALLINIYFSKNSILVILILFFFFLIYIYIFFFAARVWVFVLESFLVEITDNTLLVDFLAQTNKVYTAPSVCNKF